MAGCPRRGPPTVDAALGGRAGGDDRARRPRCRTGRRPAAGIFTDVRRARRVAAVPCPYGDGHVGERVAALLDDPYDRARCSSCASRTSAQAACPRSIARDARSWSCPSPSCSSISTTRSTRSGPGSRARGVRSPMRASESGVDDDGVRSRRWQSIAGEGTDRGRIIDRALERDRAPDGADGPASRRWSPPSGPTRRSGWRSTPGVDRALRRLGRRVPLGLVTDGDPAIQRAKLRALGLAGRFATSSCLSDELGREHRKPDPLPFEVALGRSRRRAGRRGLRGGPPGQGRRRARTPPGSAPSGSAPASTPPESTTPPRGPRRPTRWRRASCYSSGRWTEQRPMSAKWSGCSSKP